MSSRLRSQYEDSERSHALAWKHRTAHLSTEAKRPGTYRGNPFPLALPIGVADENLWAPIRPQLLELFRSAAIAWHDQDTPFFGRRAMPGPTPHLVSSQIAALNFWSGLAATPEALGVVVRCIYPEAVRVAAPVAGGPLVEPEWIGLDNYLKEKVRRGQDRTRGTMFTSADLLLAYEDLHRHRHGVLVECKYTEHALDAKFQYVSDRGTDRRDIYRADFVSALSPIRQDLGLAIDDFIIDPFYQHLREQLLAAHMAAARELDFDTVTVLHVSPRANRALHENVTSPALRHRGATLAAAWRSVLVVPETYRSVAYEDLFGIAASTGLKPLQPWVEYQRERYDWERVAHD